jgi:hypothetical protein
MLNAVLIALFVVLNIFDRADAHERPLIGTNESFIDDVSRPSTLDVDDPMAVFSFVLSQLPDRVNVYPTENYYYFFFYDRGMRYAGNIRLDASDRDDGIVHFTYYRDAADQTRQNVRTTTLGGTQGVVVDRIAPLTYRLSFAGRSVDFLLNDLSAVAPRAEIVRRDETYIGPIFDESGIRFFLLFDRRLKIFIYVLDESVTVADQFTPSGFSDRLVFGMRSNFAFYRDHRLDRKILVGVFAGDVRANNFYDGPFDQMPDNFIRGDAFRDAFRASDPRFPFAIDRFGRTGNGNRVMIRPYWLYDVEDDLRPVDRCARRHRGSARSYYRCFDHVRATSSPGGR